MPIFLKTLKNSLKITDLLTLVLTNKAAINTLTAQTISSIARDMGCMQLYWLGRIAPQADIEQLHPQ